MLIFVINPGIVNNPVLNRKISRVIVFPVADKHRHLGGVRRNRLELRMQNLEVPRTQGLDLDRPHIGMSVSVGCNRLNPVVLFWWIWVGESPGLDPLVPVVRRTNRELARRALVAKIHLKGHWEVERFDLRKEGDVLVSLTLNRQTEAHIRDSANNVSPIMGMRLNRRDWRRRP